MTAIIDCDLVSTFAKIDKLSLLEELFSKLYITESVYSELMRAKRSGFDFPDKIFRGNIHLTSLKDARGS